MVAATRPSGDGRPRATGQSTAASPPESRCGARTAVPRPELKQRWLSKIRFPLESIGVGKTVPARAKPLSESESEPGSRERAAG